MNDYQKVIFAFLVNTQKEIFSLLLQLKNIRIEDRLKFSQKLLTASQRKEISQQFSKLFLTLPSLNNLIYYPSSQAKKIHTIMKNYIDNNGELQIIAYLALEYGHPELLPYIEIYLQLLSIGNETKKINEFQR